MIALASRFVRVAEVWFDEPIGTPRPDIIRYRHSRNGPPNRAISKLSLVSDLTASVDDLWNRLKSDCRRKIRRAQETTSLTVCEPHEPRDDREIMEFAEFYNAFASVKGIVGVSTDYLRALAVEHRLWLSAVLDGSVALIRHAHIVTGQTARFLYGGAMYRNTDADQQKIISYAHRLLHWQDMIAFRIAGLTTYDWGGLFADESSHDAKGINDFKRQFGGVAVTYHEGEQALTVRGKLYLRLRPQAAAARDLLRRIRSVLSRPVAPSSPAPRPQLPAA